MDTGSCTVYILRSESDFLHVCDDTFPLSTAALVVLASEYTYTTGTCIGFLVADAHTALLFRLRPPRHFSAQRRKLHPKKLYGVHGILRSGPSSLRTAPAIVKPNQENTSLGETIINPTTHWTRLG